MNICDICGSRYQDEIVEDEELCPECKRKKQLKENPGDVGDGNEDCWDGL